MLFVKLSHSVIFFFFFQAEDGIRDYKVTGVQTCALPIFRVVERGRGHQIERQRDDQRDESDGKPRTDEDREGSRADATEQAARDGQRLRAHALFAARGFGPSRRTASRRSRGEIGFDTKMSNPAAFVRAISSGRTDALNATIG